MKILVLTKRQYMGKDLLDDRFGRFWELPLELARLGHEVQGLALSYRRRAGGTFTDGDGSSGGGVTWNSVNLLNGCLPQLEKYTRRALQISRDFRPDIVWACSDAYHAVFGNWLAKRVKSKCVIDLYDNFESYLATRIPGVLPLFKRAVKAADGITCVSPQLASYVSQRYGSCASTLVLENAIRSQLFRPMEREACRKQLGLPPRVEIIGTAGALYGSRGINTLYRGFEILAAENQSLHLALAGPRPSSGGIPRGKHIHDLGVLPLEKVAVFLNALDVSVICNRDSSFGRYNFPQKAYEIIACRVPLVAAAVGSMNELLLNYPDCLYVPENPAGLATAIRRQLLAKTVLEIPAPSWADSAAQLETFFLRIRHG